MCIIHYTDRSLVIRSRVVSKSVRPHSFWFFCPTATQSGVGGRVDWLWNAGSSVRDGEFSGSHQTLFIHDSSVCGGPVDCRGLLLQKHGMCFTLSVFLSYRWFWSPSSQRQGSLTIVLWRWVCLFSLHTQNSNILYRNLSFSFLLSGLIFPFTEYDRISH